MPDDGRYCYIIYAPSAGLVKVGSTGDPVKRIRTLRTASPVPLEVVSVARGSGAFGGGFWERQIHAEYHHLRHHGEWFQEEILSELGLLPGMVANGW